MLEIPHLTKWVLTKWVVNTIPSPFLRTSATLQIVEQNLEAIPVQYYHMMVSVEKKVLKRKIHFCVKKY